VVFGWDRTERSERRRRGILGRHGRRRPSSSTLIKRVQGLEADVDETSAGDVPLVVKGKVVLSIHRWHATVGAFGARKPQIHIEVVDATPPHAGRVAHGVAEPVRRRVRAEEEVLAGGAHSVGGGNDTTRFGKPVGSLGLPRNHFPRVFSMLCRC